MRKALASAESTAKWTKDLVKDAAGNPCGYPENVLLILRSDTRIIGRLVYDEMRDEAAWTSPPPWSTTKDGRPVTDNDGTKLVEWLGREYKLRTSLTTIHQLIDAAARERPIHWVRAYLSAVVHDKTERVAGRSGPGWLTTYLGVPDEPYVRAVGRLFLISAVARARRPSSKVDTMLILEGDQGKLKSTAVEVLFGQQYFSDQLSDIATKDASGDLRGKWVIEWSEVDHLSRSDASVLKKYISRKVDDYRPPYGRRNVQIPRQCVFVGTTNQDSYLKDETGGRRFWPVKCVEEIDIEALRRDRDQLWAEAVALFDADEKWWFTGDDGELIEAAKGEQESRRVLDPWEPIIAAALEAGEDQTTDENNNVVWVPRPAKTKVTTEEILTDVLKIPPLQQGKPQQMRAGEVLRSLGWTRHQWRVGRRVVRGYVRPPEVAESVTTVTTVTTVTEESVLPGLDPNSSVLSPTAPNSDLGSDSGNGGDKTGKEAQNGVATSEALPNGGGDGGDTPATGRPTNGHGGRSWSLEDV